MSAVAEPTPIEQAFRLRDQLAAKKVALRVARAGPWSGTANRECKLQRDIDAIQRQLHSLRRSTVLLPTPTN